MSWTAFGHSAHCPWLRIRLLRRLQACQCCSSDLYIRDIAVAEYSFRRINVLQPYCYYLSTRMRLRRLLSALFCSSSSHSSISVSELNYGCCSLLDFGFSLKWAGSCCFQITSAGGYDCYSPCSFQLLRFRKELYFVE